MSHIMSAQLRKLTEALRPLDLSGPLWRILSEIESSEAANIRDLARRTALERSNVSRLVDRLIEAGLVETVDPSDRRMHVVRLSQEGRAKYHLAASVVAPLNQVTVSVFTASELDQLNRLLERLALVLGASTD